MSAAAGRKRQRKSAAPRPLAHRTDIRSADGGTLGSSDMSRVWWPPTRNAERTGYSGMYWRVRCVPSDIARLADRANGVCRVLKRHGLKVDVEYDNGERETVLAENVSPLDVPVEFGGETVPFQEGEFVEVSNNSKTDPAAWVARVVGVTKKAVTVEYPFHDTPGETHKLALVRRARVWDEHAARWNYVRPGQDWDDGEVTSPTELEQCRNEKELLRALQGQSESNSVPAASRSKSKAAQWQTLGNGAAHGDGGPRSKRQKTEPAKSAAEPTDAATQRSTAAQRSGNPAPGTVTAASAGAGSVGAPPAQHQAPPAAKPPDPVSGPAAKTVDTLSTVPAADATAAEVATPTSPAAAEADPPANESDGATVTDEGEGGGAVAANGDAADAGDGGGGGVTSREQRPRPPRPGWPTHLPWPLPDPPPSRISLPGPRGPLVYVLASHQVTAKSKPDQQAADVLTGTDPQLPSTVGGQDK